jgi:hypothetical protein
VRSRFAALGDARHVGPGCRGGISVRVLGIPAIVSTSFCLLCVTGLSSRSQRSITLGVQTEGVVSSREVLIAANRSYICDPDTIENLQFITDTQSIEIGERDA